MRYKISQVDFFKKKPLGQDGTVEIPVSATKAGEGTKECASGEKDTIILEKDTDAAGTVVHTVRAEPLKVGNEVDMCVAQCCAAIKKVGLPRIAEELEKVRRNAVHERFTIAVVGEFSRGKSTFINRFLDKDFLPVGNLPTTAVMTRIRHNPREILVAFDEKGEKVFERPLTGDCWDGLVAENFGGKDFKGIVLAGVNSDWLKECNVELIDTPGVGDLSEARAEVIGDALLGCDGAIIAVNANTPLSLSEKLFIEERLLARKLPFLMLIITKLDQIPLGQRGDVVRYIQAKLKSWNMDIPVFVPYQVEFGEEGFENIVGMDKIKERILGWIEYPERIRLTEQWILSKTEDALKNAISSLSEKKFLLETMDNEKREKQIADKKDQLTKARLAWGDLRLQMEHRCTQCYQFLLDKIDEYAENITSRLQYEASHTNNVQKWWEEDYPYRLKIELTNLSAGVENLVSKKISEDAQWYCSAIKQTFHSCVLYQKETISDKSFFGDFQAGGEIEFEDLDTKRTAVKIGSAVLSISGVLLFSAMGFMPIVATMGIGTGTAIVSERLFKKKIEQQREIVKRKIAQSVPGFIQDCMAESESRLSAVYRNILDEAEKSEQEWLDAQEAAIKAVQVPHGDDEDPYKEVCGRLEILSREAAKLDTVKYGRK